MDTKFKRKSSSRNKDIIAVSTVLGKNWFDVYAGYLRGVNLVQADLYLDILKDLCEESLPNDVTIHLLALLELNSWVLDDADKYVSLCIHCLLITINHPAG